MDKSVLSSVVLTGFLLLLFVPLALTEKKTLVARTLYALSGMFLALWLGPLFYDIELDRHEQS